MGQAEGITGCGFLVAQFSLVESFCWFGLPGTRVTCQHIAHGGLGPEGIFGDKEPGFEGPHVQTRPLRTRWTAWEGLGLRWDRDQASQGQAGRCGWAAAKRQKGPYISPNAEPWGNRDITGCRFSLRSFLQLRKISPAKPTVSAAISGCAGPGSLGAQPGWGSKHDL